MPLSRAASYTDLRYAPATEPAPSSLRRTFSDCVVPTLSDSPTKESVAAGKDILRRTSLRSKDRPALLSRFTLSSEDSNKAAHVKSQHAGEPGSETRAPEPVARPSKSRGMSGRIVNLARKPWGASSRSPSPSTKRFKQQQDRAEERSPTRSRGSAKTATATETPAGSDSAQPSRKRTMLYKRPRRPTLAVVAKGNNVDSLSSPSSPSGHSLRHQSSFEKFAASLSISTPVLPPMLKAAPVTTAAFSNSAGAPPRRKDEKDELWGVFRSLEAEYQKCVQMCMLKL